jgi:ankyrin repeat protein
MFLPPHSALPLPARPSLERYRKLAKDLLKVCNDPAALRAWVEDWVASVVRLSEIEITPHLPVSLREWTDNIASFAQETLGGDRRSLAHAQFVLARAHGFPNWPDFVTHVRAFEQAASPQARFEAAADAVIRGDAATLRQLLREDPTLINIRSTREHHATLLHYTAANGVEGYRQKTPANIVEIAETLLQSGAEIDAEADLYGGGSTTLMLAATSGHPERAGEQNALLALLIDQGAKIDHNGRSAIAACLANGRFRAAQFLAEHGAHLGFAEAAALGRLDLIETAFQSPQAETPTAEEIDRAFLLACQYGQLETATILLARGASLAATTRDGQTPLHLAAMSANALLLQSLLRHNPSLEAQNSYGGTPLGQALWSAAHSPHPVAYVGVLDALAEAGAQLPRNCQPIGPAIDAWLAQRGCLVEPGD